MPNCAAMEGLALTQSESITPDSRALLPNPTASGRAGAPSWRSLPLCPMAEVGSAHQRLRDHLHQTRLLGSISSALYYDQNTVMPAAGAAWRGEQLALLATQLHQRQSSDAYTDLLAAAEAEIDPESSEASRRNLALLRLELERQRCLDPTLVAQLAKAQSRGNALWQEARRRNDFPSFAPALAELIALRREQASQLATAEPIPRSPWETLAQPFEPEISKARLRELFQPLQQRIPALLERVNGAPPSPPEAVALPESIQEDLCSQLLDSWGYDPARCQRSRSPHPFSCTVGPDDFRITTRVVEGQPFSAFLATAHEWGHSLYEQGLPRHGDHYFPWPLGEATSMGVHESQSLFWECRVARGQAFAARWQPRFVQAFGTDPWGGAHGFWRGLNPLRPGLIRVEADELSYTLHIVLRFELEQALLEEGLPVLELPAAWNRRMVELLGLTPPNDREGCLQDIHWAEGLFGYFPSYALGHLISAQVSETMEAQLGPIENLVASGEAARLRGWLDEQVWPLGRSVTGDQLVERVSGAPLSAEPFLRYLEEKVNRLLAEA
jgi:carboxypeptidase Taq